MFQLISNIAVDCEWSAYGNWSDCSTSCGEGVKSARRKVSQMALNGGKLCEGSAIITENCDLGPCPGISILLKYEKSNFLSFLFLKHIFIKS